MQRCTSWPIGFILYLSFACSHDNQTVLMFSWKNGSKNNIFDKLFPRVRILCNKKQRDIFASQKFYVSRVLVAQMTQRCAWTWFYYPIIKCYYYLNTWHCSCVHVSIFEIRACKKPKRNPIVFKPMLHYCQCFIWKSLVVCHQTFAFGIK